MVKEDKVILMTKLAMYEQNEGKESIPVSRYYRSDYISKKLIETSVTTTIGYVLMVILLVLFKVDYLSDNIVKMDLFEICKQGLIGYVVTMILFLIIAYAVYSIRYRRIKESLAEYSENLKELYMMYKREMNTKKKEEARALAGGRNYDDTTGF